MPAPRRVDLGQRFGLLVVTSIGAAARHRRCSCLCDCGTRKEVLIDNLRRGLTNSCGCAQRQAASQKFTRHGHARVARQSAEYRAWCSAKRRVSVPTAHEYARYGGRGITMAPEFAVSFEVFFAHVGKRPTPKHTLGRIDNEQGYVPGNIRWETREQQNRNRRTTRLSLEKAREIRMLAPSTSVRALAKRYGVDPVLIRGVVRGDIWKEGGTDAASAS